MSFSLGPYLGRRSWGRRGIAYDGGEALVLKATFVYRLQGLVAFLLGLGISIYFSLLFFLSRSMAAILALGVFWALGVLVLWAGLTMLLDPSMVQFCKHPGAVEVIERKFLPFLRERRRIPLDQVLGILLRQERSGGVFGGGPSYILELLLVDRDRIEIDRGGAIFRQRMLLLADRVKEATGKPIIEEEEGELERRREGGKVGKTT
jgi:hypothetical protein